MKRPVRRWIVAGWAALVLAGGAYTLYLDDGKSAATEPARWERAPSRQDEPRPCPTPSGGATPTMYDCTYWERG